MTRPWAQALTAQSRRILADRPAPGTCDAVQTARARLTDPERIGAAETPKTPPPPHHSH